MVSGSLARLAKNRSLLLGVLPASVFCCSLLCTVDEFKATLSDPAVIEPLANFVIRVLSVSGEAHSLRIACSARSFAS